ncbi:MAG: hypothetical protein LWX07_06415 [Bacteroidetes bacterium]|nr:hypothetical protein [Bacteroidota bacterium]
MKYKYLTPTPAKLTIAFIVITIIISILFIFYYNHRKELVETNYFRELSILTDSKLKRIESARKEIIGAANTISENLELLPRIKMYFKNRWDISNNVYVEQFLGLYLKYYYYKDVVLVDSSMNVMYSAGNFTKSVGAPTKGFIKTAAENKKP